MDRNEFWASYEATSQAEPTSRLIPEPYDKGEEWVEKGIFKGQSVYVYYFFDEDEVDIEANGLNPDNPPEDYPWDADHILHVIADDDDLTVIIPQTQYLFV